MLAAVFSPGPLALLDPAPRLGVVLALGLWGLALLWPRRGPGPVLALLLALGTVTGSAWVLEPPGSASSRLGVTPRGAGPDGGVELAQVHPGSPAQGLLEVGDRILAVDAQPLSAQAPEADLRQRVRAAGGGAPVELFLNVERAGERREVRIALGAAPPSRLFSPQAQLGLCLRALGMSLLVALLVWRDGQGPAQLGLVREGLEHEPRRGLFVLAGAYAVLLVSALPLSALAQRLGMAQRELLARQELISLLTGTGLGVPAFAAAMVLIASFEELVFRGFLVPRLRVLVGHWGWAVAVGAGLFGLGHVYEGVFAAVQITLLGAWFGYSFLARARLPAVMGAHAAFNTLNFALMLWMQRTGAAERLFHDLPK